MALENSVPYCKCTDIVFQSIIKMLYNTGGTPISKQILCNPTQILQSYCILIIHNEQDQTSNHSKKSVPFGGLEWVKEEDTKGIKNLIAYKSIRQTTWRNELKISVVAIIEIP